ncbi:hypothetical protein [Halostella sp. PRR32]|uniref:hypothetical protein n=1 Tax=Halostella sp. PRR32 TaxID=3098147 RepID=UPI002B1D58CA|nr:hypothetical protein [Halostella sp. PRR32]
MEELAAAGVVLFQAGIVVILLEAIRRRNAAALVNALVSFGATLLPAVVEFVVQFLVAQSVSFGPELPLWIAAAGCLHSFGMLGPYDSIPWWDSLTHTVSAALIAALLYDSLIVVAGSGDGFGLPFGLIAVLTVLFTFAGGVFWELIELVARDIGERYDVEPVLVHYGRRDTTLDLVFDVLGALLVVSLDVRVFVPVAEQFPRATRSLVLGSGVVIVVGSVLMALTVSYGRRH